MLKNISWSRGFLRLWFIYGFVVVIATTATIYCITPSMPHETLLYNPKSGNFETISDLYDLLFDYEISKKMSEYKKENHTYTIENHLLLFPKAISKKTIESKISEYREKYSTAYNLKLLEVRMRVFMVGLGFLLVPLIIGLCVKWILIGFRSKSVQ